PLDGILVGGTTHRATAAVVAYRSAEPVGAWEALHARTRPGAIVESGRPTPLVGREAELDLLGSALERALRGDSAQLVTLVGVPGIGKSRLVAELRSRVSNVTWRQGRSLPYGQGVTCWALAEIVKEQAGILETDPAEVAAGKLSRAVRSALGDEQE